MNAVVAMAVRAAAVKVTSCLFMQKLGGSERGKFSLTVSITIKASEKEGKPNNIFLDFYWSGHTN